MISYQIDKNAIVTIERKAGSVTMTLHTRSEGTEHSLRVVMQESDAQVLAVALKGVDDAAVEEG